MAKSQIIMRSAVYGIVGLSSFIYQPNWFYQNFWSRADFWDQWGFRIPFVMFCGIYAGLAVAFTHSLIVFTKKYL